MANNPNNHLQVLYVENAAIACKCFRFDELDKLDDEIPIASWRLLHVNHQQIDPATGQLEVHPTTGDPVTRRTSFSGRHTVALKKTPAGLLIRQYDPPSFNQGVGENAQFRWFFDNGNQQGQTDWPAASLSEAAVTAGMDLAMLGYDGPNTDDLLAEAQAYDLSTCVLA